MGSFICRQPNGLLCRFSTVVDTVTDYNMTDEEYIQMYIQKKITTARAEAEYIIKNHLKPFEWIDDYFVDNNMTEEEFEQIKAKMCVPKGDDTQKSEPDDFHEYWDEMAISELKGENKQTDVSVDPYDMKYIRCGKGE